MYLRAHFGPTTLASLHIYFLCTTLHKSSPAAAAGGGKGEGAERAGLWQRESPGGAIIALNP